MARILDTIIFQTPLFASTCYQPLDAFYISRSLLFFCYEWNVGGPFVSQHKRSNVFTKPPVNDSYRIVCIR